MSLLIVMLIIIYDNLQIFYKENYDIPYTDCNEIFQASKGYKDIYLQEIHWQSLLRGLDNGFKNVI